jgi:hypothetical protein
MEIQYLKSGNDYEPQHEDNFHFLLIYLILAI